MEEKMAVYFAVLLTAFLVVGFLPFSNVFMTTAVVGVCIDFIRFLLKKRF